MANPACLLTGLGFILFVSSAAWAAPTPRTTLLPPGALTDPFCQDAEQVICEGAPARSKARSALQTKIVRAALPQPESETARGLTRLILGEAKHFPLTDDNIVEFAGHLRSYHQALARRSVFTEKQLQERIQIVRQGFLKIIAAEKSLSDAQKKILVRKTLGLQVLFLDGFFPFFEKHGVQGEKNAEGAAEVITTLVQACSLDGMATQVRLQKRTLEIPIDFAYVCPGSVLDLGPAAEREAALTTSLAASFGAQLYDKEVFEIYQPFSACYLEKFSKEPGNAWTKWEGQAKWFSFQSVVFKMGVSYWMAQFLADGLESKQLPSESMTAYLGAYCEEKETRDQPSSRFRINVGFGRNPRLRQVLGCKPLGAEVPFCAL